MAYSLFSVFGVEIEYAVVRRDTVAIDPSVDRLIEALAGSPNGHPIHANVEVDNELAAHVVEFKCLKPTADLITQAQDFAATVKIVNGALSRWNTQLMPGGMHPFMDPLHESRLWAHEDRRIYETYDRIFECHGHGWFNIQSVHLNLPFANDAEFSQLHNAISLLLPLLPALGAASPLFNNQHNGWLDGRLFHYVSNQRRLPSILGGIIPEPVGNEEEYREKILAPMFRDIAPLDPEGLLEEEWLNSRAAIARFDRGAIEIRCLDTQERPLSDLALCHWISSVLKYLLGTESRVLQAHRKVPAGLLKKLFLDSAQYGMLAQMPGDFPFSVFGLEVCRTTGDFLKALTRIVFQPASQIMTTPELNAFFLPSIDLILSQGNLAERILKSVKRPSDYLAVYKRLCECLESGEAFVA